MNYESHIILLPEDAGWDTYEAIRSCLETYRVTTTKSADDAGSFHGTKHTATILQAPGAWPSGIVPFFQQRYPNVRLDVIPYKTLAELTQVLQRRVAFSGLPQGRFVNAKFIEAVGTKPADPFVYDSHIVLIPNGSDWRWYQAAREYLLTFRVTVTQSADDAGSFHARNHTITAVDYPGAWGGGDIRAFLRANYPSARIDFLAVDTPDDLTRVLNYRVTLNDRFATPSSTLTDLPSLRWPCDPNRLPPRLSNISQMFADRPWVYRQISPTLLGHEGIDLLAPVGTPVLACTGGTVVELSTDPNARGYGMYVKLRHSLPVQSYETVYAHLSRVDVRLGQKVGSGQSLGLSGNTGNSTGPHLHLHLQRADKIGAPFHERYIDPLPYLEIDKRPVADTDLPMIYGTHEDFEGVEAEKKSAVIMQQAGVRGYVLWTEAIGSDPNDQRGVDYIQRTKGNHTIIVRLNNDYGNAGTIPTPDKYQAFAQRCANFARNSRGVRIFVIGNEMNNPREWPLGQPITAEQYATCFNLVYRAIKAEQPDAIVCPGAIDPYNAALGFAPYHLPQGDVRVYWQIMLEKIAQCDGLALHAYTRGPDPQLIDNDDTFGNAPLLGLRLNFGVFADVLATTPAKFRGLPVYITETNHLWPVREGEFGWLDENKGWVWKMYQTVNEWNARGGQQIYCALLYRWPRIDDWHIVDRPNVVEDFKQAIRMGFRPYRG